MTVAVFCNLSEGVILGVDSAASFPGPGGVAKVYENAEKLFQLANRPIGVAVFGLGGLGTRSIGCYLRKFGLHDPGQVVAGVSNTSRSNNCAALSSRHTSRRSCLPSRLR